MNNSFADGIKLAQVQNSYNIDNSLFSIVSLKKISELFFLEIPNQYENILSDFKEYDETSVLVEFIGAQNTNISKNQYKALKNLLDHENIIAAKVKNGVYSYYKTIRPAFVEGVSGSLTSAEIEKTYPKILTGDELRDKIRLSSIYIYPSQNGASPMVLNFSWMFEDEGVYVHIKGTDVIYVGGNSDFNVSN